MRLIEDPTALPPSTRMALLQGFGLNAEWTTDQEPALRFIDPRTLNNLVDQHPKAFQPA